MRILHLTLHRKWFDEIATGKKKEEYRERKPYWQKKFFPACGVSTAYTHIHFRNGYAKNAPWMCVKLLGITLGNWEGELCYKILLGEVLEIKNWEGAK